MKHAKILFVLLATPLGTTQVSAAPVTWYLQDVVFNDGSTAEGSFDFDPDVSFDKYSSINITTDVGQYGNLFFSGSGPTLFISVPDESNLDGFPYLRLAFASQEGLAGGEDTVDLVTGSSGSAEGMCSSPRCNTGAEKRYLSGGSVTTVAPSPEMPTSPSPLLPSPTQMPSPPATLPTTVPGPPSSLVTWYLQNVEFSDGTTATGSFDFDTVNNTYSNIVIRTGQDEYKVLSSVLPSSNTTLTLFREEAMGLIDLDGQRYLRIRFALPIDQATGDSLGIENTLSNEGVCSDSSCNVRLPERSMLRGGFVTTVPPPPPSAMPSNLPSVTPSTAVPSATPSDTRTPPVKWYLRNVAFSDGTIATGFFFFDGENYLNITISTGLWEYGVPNPFSGDTFLETIPEGASFDELTGIPILSFLFTSPLTQGEDRVDITRGSSSYELVCPDDFCFDDPDRVVASGFVTTVAATPIPSAPPTPMPSPLPSTRPSGLPTPMPNTIFAAPTKVPSEVPSLSPTAPPSDLPTTMPSLSPTALPSGIPTTIPSPSPTALPNDKRTTMPSLLPTPLPVNPPMTEAPFVPPTPLFVNPPMPLPVNPPTDAPFVPPTPPFVKPPTPLPVNPSTPIPVNPPTETPFVKPMPIPLPMPELIHPPISYTMSGKGKGSKGKGSKGKGMSSSSSNS